MSSILLYGDSIRSAALRHEVPLAIMDSFLFVADGDRSLVLTSSLEGGRITEARPDAELLFVEDLGFFELVQEGFTFEGADLETVVRDLVRDHPRDNPDRGVVASPLIDEVVGDYRQRLAVLLGVPKKEKAYVHAGRR